jgi:hypothetical protein
VTLRCNVAPCNLPPVTFNPLAPHPLAPPPLPRCRYGRSGAAPPTSSYYPAPRASRPSRSLPRASRLIPLRPYHCPAAGTGAAPLRPYVVLPPCPSCLAPLSLLASRLAPHPLAPPPLPRCRYGRSAAAPTSSYHPAPRASRPSRSLPRASRLIPSRPHHCPAAGTGAAPLRPLRRPTTLPLAPRAPLAPCLAPCASSPRAPTTASLPVRAQRRCAPTSSYHPAPRASRPSRSLPRALRLIPSRPYYCLAAGTGAAPLRPYVVLPPCPSCLVPLSLPALRLAPLASRPYHCPAAGTGAAVLRPLRRPTTLPLAPRAARLRQTDIIADYADASAIEHPMRSASSNLVS